MRRRDSVLIALGGLCLVPAARAQDREPPEIAAPDIELLEYLGSWQADDEEAWAIAEWDKDNAADRERDESRKDREEEDEGTDGAHEDRDDEDSESK
jgi:hypothetical protein